MKPLTPALFVVLTITAVSFLPQTTVWAQPSVAPAGWLTWHVETVAGPEAHSPWLALDSNDQPAISYSSYLSTSIWTYALTYARRVAGQWTNEQVADFGIGGPSRLRFDSADQAQIAFVKSGVVSREAGFAERSTSGWVVQKNAFPDAADELSLALDQSGNAYVAFCGGIYHRTGATWTQEATNSDWVCSSTSLALDSSDRPGIAYYSFSAHAVRYVYWTGSAWNTDTVDTVGDFLYHSWPDISLAFGADGRPHIAYYDSNNHDLKYAVKSGTAWTIQTVDAYGDVGGAASLALDRLGNPHIAYRDGSHGTVKYAFWNGSVWSYSFVLPARQGVMVPSQGVSLALDSSDLPHIALDAYPYQGGDVVLYARGEILPFALFLPLAGR